MLLTTLRENFAAAMARLGPFGAAPKLAVAVSGGADSTALVLLAQSWAQARGGHVVALIVDHGLRTGSAAEAALTAARLAERGILAEVSTLTGLAGPALQARARTARYLALAAGARRAGCVHVLLGHHAGDQAETMSMRAARGQSEVSGMAAWSARHGIVILRPLLTVTKADLVSFLRAETMAWVEDPSNDDRRFERVRVRQDGVAAVLPAVRNEPEVAAFLACHVAIRPEGFAVVDAARMPAAALAALLRMIGGRSFAPAQDAVAGLAADLRPATLGGVRIAAAGRLGGAWLLAREPAGCATAVQAAHGAEWDNRFRLNESPGSGTFGALGAQAAEMRGENDLPALVLRSMPCLRDPEGRVKFPVNAAFCPPLPATSQCILA